MKGFIVSIILLLIAGGIIFFLGWTQLYVKPGDLVVIHTKTGGWQREIIRSGEFVWQWEAVFPTVQQRYHFSDLHMTANIVFSETLPSGETYRNYIPSSPDFTYAVEGEIEYHIVPEKLPELAENEGLRPDTHEEYLESLGPDIQLLMNQHIPDIINRIQAENDDTSVITVFQSELDRIIREGIPQHIEILSLNLTRLTLPDLELYRTAKKEYYAVLEVESSIRTQSKVESLKEIADLLNSYPGLLEYLKAATETGNDVLDVSSLIRNALTEPLEKNQ
ncbi:MAG: hypothetical protein ACR2PY_02900 [Salinispira sp.]